MHCPYSGVPVHDCQYVYGFQPDSARRSRPKARTAPDTERAWLNAPAGTMRLPLAQLQRLPALRGRSMLAGSQRHAVASGRPCRLDQFCGDYKLGLRSSAPPFGNGRANSQISHVSWRWAISCRVHVAWSRWRSLAAVEIACFSFATCAT